MPQSASGSWTLPVGVTAWPRTTRPVIADVPTSPVAPAGPAAAPARTVTDSATTSPPSAETASARIAPSADEEMPGCAVAVAVEAPMRSTDPSAGKANAPPPLTAGGADCRASPPRPARDGHLRDERGGARLRRRGGRRTRPRRGPRRQRRAGARLRRGRPLTTRQGSAPVPGGPGSRAGRRREQQHAEGAAGGLVDPSRSGCRPRRPRSRRPRRRAPAHPQVAVRPLADRAVAAVGTIARSDVAAASTWPSPSSTSVGTNRIPPPTPKIPEDAGGEPERRDDRPRAHPAISQTPMTASSAGEGERQLGPRCAAAGARPRRRRRRPGRRRARRTPAAPRRGRRTGHARGARSRGSRRARSRSPRARERREHDEQRDDDDPAADAEHGREDPGDETDQGEPRGQGTRSDAPLVS